MVSFLHRTDRTGFKAGALDAGLKLCKGDFIAIFGRPAPPPPSTTTTIPSQTPSTTTR